MRRLLLGALPFAVLAAMLALRAWDPLPLQQLRWLAFDQYQRLAPRVRPGRAGQDRRHRRRVARPHRPMALATHATGETARAPHQAGAAAIAFDIVFAERDRSSPEQVLKLWEATWRCRRCGTASPFCRRTTACLRPPSSGPGGDRVRPDPTAERRFQPWRLPVPGRRRDPESLLASVLADARPSRAMRRSAARPRPKRPSPLPATIPRSSCARSAAPSPIWPSWRRSRRAMARSTRRPTSTR